MESVPENQNEQKSVTPMPVAKQSSYTGWLISDSFIKRALAVFGYGIIGQLLFALAIIVIGIAFGSLVGITNLVS